MQSRPVPRENAHGCAQTGRDGAVFGGHVVFKPLRPERCAYAGCRFEILDRVGESVERAQELAVDRRSSAAFASARARSAVTVMKAESMPVVPTCVRPAEV